MTNTDPNADCVALNVVDPRWHALEIEALTSQIVSHLLLRFELTGYGVSVLCTNDAEVAQLNAEFRSKDQPTNVLSWPAFSLASDTPGERPLPPPELSEHDDLLGDIALAYETCLKEAVEAGLSLRDHICHLVLHGCLHLLGYDHENEPDAALMEGLETEILASMGIKDPYA